MCAFHEGLWSWILPELSAEELLESEIDSFSAKDLGFHYSNC